ncbi:MAG: hypothetical protein ACPHIW_02635 [Ilumatobacteraceae bacterium]
MNGSVVVVLVVLVVSAGTVVDDSTGVDSSVVGSTGAVEVVTDVAGSSISAAGSLVSAVSPSD